VRIVTSFHCKHFLYQTSRCHEKYWLLFKTRWMSKANYSLKFDVIS